MIQLKIQGANKSWMINPRPAMELTYEASSIIIISSHLRSRSGMTSLKRSLKKMPAVDPVTILASAALWPDPTEQRPTAFRRRSIGSDSPLRCQQHARVADDQISGTVKYRIKAVDGLGEAYNAILDAGETDIPNSLLKIVEGEFVNDDYDAWYLAFTMPAIVSGTAVVGRICGCGDICGTFELLFLTEKNGWMVADSSKIIEWMV